MAAYGRAMATFAELELSAPPIAAFLGARIEATGLCLLGTTRPTAGRGSAHWS